MNLEEPSKQIRAVMAKVFNVEESSLPPEPDFDGVAAWTSLAHLRLIMALENAFTVKFKMETVPELTSLAKIQAAISDGKRS